MPKRRRAHDRAFDAVLGFLLGLGAPVGWLGLRLFISQHPLLISWLKVELHQHGEIYAYMTVGTVTVFTLFGYLLGRKTDDVTSEAESARDTLETVNQMAVTDALTGIHNARYLHDHLTQEVESAKRYQTPLSCLMLDIDNFKRINDTHGHPFGDVVLATLAKTLRQCVRQVDIVGRLGGEEFLVVMPHTAPETAIVIGERIRQAVQAWPFTADDVSVPVTVSIGVSHCPAPGISDKSALLKAADDALYEAKRTGKNKIVVADALRRL